MSGRERGQPENPGREGLSPEPEGAVANRPAVRHHVGDFSIHPELRISGLTGLVATTFARWKIRLF